MVIQMQIISEKINQNDTGENIDVIKMCAICSGAYKLMERRT